MKTEDLAVDKGGQGKVVEEVGEVPVGRCQRLSLDILFNSLPNIGIAVFSQALVIESVNLRDLPAFVISSQDGNTFRKPHLERYCAQHFINTVVKL